MLQEVDWPDNRDYRSDTEREPLEFYLSAFAHSNRLDLLLGYFSFSAINVLSFGFAKFIANGGTMRVVANNILSSKDKETIMKANDPDLNGLIDLADVRGLKFILEDYGTHFFECMAWLIHEKRLEIVLVRPKDRKGISHFKSGVFYDHESKVGFTASSNFTAYGMLENSEEVSAFLKWENSRSSKKIQALEDYFEQIFSGEADFVEYIPIEHAVNAVLEEFGGKTLEELELNQGKLAELKLHKTRNSRLQKVLATLEVETNEYLDSGPRFPFPQGPRDYQKEAYEAWVNNGYKGIFAMATGTGKTLTALNCLLNVFYSSGSYKAVIVVPTIALVDQWKKECLKFNFQNIITVSSRQKWDANMAFFNTASKYISTSYIVIVTYASFHRPKFQHQFKKLDSGTLFIADEAHNLGAGKVAKTLKTIHLKKRIGLSATIERKYDDEGNEVIQEFFNDQPPYVISYTMKMALDIGWLCQYKYIPHLVELGTGELSNYMDISKKLMRFFDASTGSYKKSKEVETLLLMRKRIIHKAKGKLPIFRKILKEEYQRKGDLKYTLIYVPEGKDPNFDVRDEIEMDEDDVKLIHSYTRAVSDVDISVMVKQYTSSATGRDVILEDFENGKIHALTSMKCLDEGVDVPRSELAIFCASTGNPRQFIQRRGRVLRLHDDKNLSTIHDLVVVPKIDHYSEQFNMEKTIVRKELERVVDFSSLAINKFDTYEVLEDVLDHYGLNLYEIDKNTEI